MTNNFVWEYKEFKADGFKVVQKYELRLGSSIVVLSQNNLTNTYSAQLYYFNQRKNERYLQYCEDLNIPIAKDNLEDAKTLAVQEANRYLREISEKFKKMYDDFNSELYLRQYKLNPGVTTDSDIPSWQDTPIGVTLIVDDILVTVKHEYKNVYLVSYWISLQDTIPIYKEHIELVDRITEHGTYNLGLIDAKELARLTANTRVASYKKKWLEQYQQRMDELLDEVEQLDI